MRERREQTTSPLRCFSPHRAPAMPYPRPLPPPLHSAPAQRAVLSTPCASAVLPAPAPPLPFQHHPAGSPSPPRAVAGSLLSGRRRYIVV
uniref:Uncharacterized protein n=1 Tax=Oryza glumipatula TaxID=40148 RepID=A0A0E0AHU9_9ORYZ